MSKIIICGLNGAGKSTLAKELAKRINYIHKDIEDYYFTNNVNYKYSKSRTREEVTKNLEDDFCRYDNIVFSSCKSDYGNISELFDLAILIKIDKQTSLNRVKERSYKKFGNRVLEGGDLYESEKKFWNFVSNKDESAIVDWFNSLKCKKLEIDGNSSIDENLKILIEEIK